MFGYLRLSLSFFLLVEKVPSDPQKNFSVILVSLWDVIPLMNSITVVSHFCLRVHCFVQCGVLTTIAGISLVKLGISTLLHNGDTGKGQLVGSLLYVFTFPTVLIFKHLVTLLLYQDSSHPLWPYVYLPFRLNLECFLCHCYHYGINPNQFQLPFLKYCRTTVLNLFKMQTELNLLFISFELEHLLRPLPTCIILWFYHLICVPQWTLCVFPHPVWCFKSEAIFSPFERAVWCMWSRSIMSRICAKHFILTLFFFLCPKLLLIDKLL